MWHEEEHGSTREAGDPYSESLSLGMGKERLDPREVRIRIGEEAIKPGRKLGSE